MPALSPEVVKKFCNICNDTYTAWNMHRIFFDDNPKVKLFDWDHGKYYFDYLAKSGKAYISMGIVKLHDPAVQGKGINLSLDYIITFGGWDRETAKNLNNIRIKLEELASSFLKSVRNKMYCHNDLAAILNDELMEGLPRANEYFEYLQEFMNIVHRQVAGEIFPYSTNSIGDADVVLKIITTGIEAHLRPPA